MADVAVVGKFSSAEALGAVGSTTILVSLFTGFLIGMGSAVNVRVAQHLGAKRRGANYCFCPHVVCNLPCGRNNYYVAVPFIGTIYAGVA